mmetsp:Transcript_3455/g.4666  ORF Transcript_3455/g.4666 Transcript_3455/m.4666 type:complete len:430 (-) Transcript_3455:120-1409(-)
MGTKMSVAPVVSAKEAKEGKEENSEDRIPVSNFFLVKHIVEDGDDNLTLVGTMVQKVFETDRLERSESAKAFYFEYRFNDLMADEDSGYAKRRRSEKCVRSKCTKATFQMSAPLDVDTIFDVFPFKAYKASVLVELSSSTIEEETHRVRPNLLVAKHDTRNNLSIQLPYINKMQEARTNDSQLLEDLKDKMDKMQDYDFITPFPNVEYIYDKKKKYCPKCRITFYLVQQGNSKMIEIIAPMLLISILNTLNVINDEKVENVDYIANSAAFTLTAAFILPSIFSKANRNKVFTVNTVYVFLVFVGLALSSFPDDMVGTNGFAITGVVLLWLSFFMPVISFIRFWRFQNQVSPTQGRADIDDFIERKNYKQFNHEKDNFKEHFLCVGDVPTKDKDNKYIRTDEGKYLWTDEGKYLFVEYRKERASCCLPGR